MSGRLIKQSLVSATLIMVAGNILGRLFGFAREAVIASYFGTSSILDTFILAFTIPEMLAMVLFTALPVALIPTLKNGDAATQSDQERDSALFWSGLGWFAMIFGGLSVMVFLFREQILFWLSPELAGPNLALGHKLLAILSPYILLRGLEAYFRSWCFAKKHFVASATSNIIINICVIASVYFFYDRMEIETLAYGWLVGSFLLLVYNGVFALGIVSLSRPTGAGQVWMRVLLQSLIAIVLLESISMAYPVVDRILAARYLEPGPISALRYATTLISIPTGVFVAAFNIAAFPWIADLSSVDQAEKLRQLYFRSVRLLIFFIGLVAAGVMLFSADIVQLAFKRGAFDAASLELTSEPMFYYAIGMVFQAVYTFQMRFYYVRRMLLRVGIILISMFAVKLILSWILIGQMEHNGLALATSIARIFGFAIMTVDLARTLKVSSRELFFPFVMKTLAAIGAVAVMWFGLAAVWPLSATSTVAAAFFRLAVIGLIGIGVYLGMGMVLKMSEPRSAIESLTVRFGGDR